MNERPPSHGRAADLGAGIAIRIGVGAAMGFCQQESD